MATVLLCGVDLFFRGKLDALLTGHRLITVEHTESPDLVIQVVSGLVLVALGLLRFFHRDWWLHVA